MTSSPPLANIQSELGPSAALHVRRRKGKRTYGARPQRAEWRVPSLPIESPRSWNKDLGRVPARHPECDIDGEQLIKRELRKLPAPVWIRNAPPPTTPISENHYHSAGGGG